MSRSRLEGTAAAALARRGSMAIPTSKGIARPAMRATASVNDQAASVSTLPGNLLSRTFCNLILLPSLEQRTRAVRAFHVDREMLLANRQIHPFRCCHKVKTLTSWMDQEMARTSGGHNPSSDSGVIHGGRSTCVQLSCLTASPGQRFSSFLLIDTLWQPERMNAAVGGLSRNSPSIVLSQILIASA